MLKAEALLKLSSDIKPGEYITWPVYEGKDILAAKMIEDYVTPFFRTGTMMPIPILNLGLDIQLITVGYDDRNNTHQVIIEGLVKKFKERD